MTPRRPGVDEDRPLGSLRIGERTRIVVMDERQRLGSLAVPRLLALLGLSGLLRSATRSADLRTHASLARRAASQRDEHHQRDARDAHDAHDGWGSHGRPHAHLQGVSPRTVSAHGVAVLHTPETQRTSMVTVRLSSLPLEKMPVSPHSAVALSGPLAFVELAFTAEHS